MNRFKGFGMSLDTSSYATTQSKYSIPQVLVSSPDPQNVVIAAPPQNIVIALPTVSPDIVYAPPTMLPGDHPILLPGDSTVLRQQAATGVRSPDIVYAPPTMLPGDHPIFLPGNSTVLRQKAALTTASGGPSFEPGDPSLRPMGLTPVDPGTGEALATTGIRAPPQASPESTSSSTIALVAGGVALAAGLWFVTR